jgi:hypothetical protein
MRFLPILALASILAFPAMAHEPRPGPNGGMLVDAGETMHVELVASGTPEISLFLYDASDQPVPAEGYSGQAILLVDGVTLRIPLEAAEGSRMTGKAPASVPQGVKGAVQLKGPDGATAQAKF